jgi:hypothetical protein
MPRALKSAKAWLTLAVAAGYLLLPRLVPHRFETEKDWCPGYNWFGQPHWTALLYGGGLLIALCTLRFLIVTKSRRASDAVAWYCLALAVILPAVWLLVVVDWDNEAVAEIACWVGYPIALLTVPSCLFCLDLVSRSPLSPGSCALRTLAELCGLVPVWLFVWTYAEFFILGWVGP